MAHDPAEVTYLQSAHKFYEVTVDGPRVVVRFGKVGAAGTRQETTLADRAAAEAFAKKKLAEKLRRGYAPPAGASSALAAAAAATPAKPAPSSVQYTRSDVLDRAPVLWAAETGAPGFGLFVDAERCYAGNQAGDVLVLDREGALRTRFALPRGVKCLIGDEDWRYAGCDDGNVYELEGRGRARLAYEVEADANLFWLEVRDGVLFVSDNAGRVTAIDHESERLWSAQSEGRAGWMVRADDRAVYHGHSAGLTAYARKDGKVLWSERTGGAVMFGWREGATLYVATNQKRVEAYTTRGVAGAVYPCDAAVLSCAASPGGRHVFAADSAAWIYCFARSGERLWKLRAPGEPVCSMQYLDERLYLLSTAGSLACLDASDAAIAAAQQGTVPVTRRAPVAPRAGAHPAAAPASATDAVAALPVARDAGTGVLLECVREGGRLRVRVLSPGYDPARRCQFPRDLRVEGARYVVDAVRPSRDGEFYRALGEIKRVE